MRDNIKMIANEISKPKSETYDTLRHVSIDKYLDESLYKNPKYQNPKKLNRFEFQVYSQSGEDGILQEIFRRIGSTNEFFVEFGAGDGTLNNSTYLLVKGWSGVWIEVDPKHVVAIQNKFGSLLRGSRLRLENACVTAENVESLFEELAAPRDPDLLCISIDGNDYWVWQSIGNYIPRVIVIEYNSMFVPDVRWVMKHNSRHSWAGSSYFGASLKSLEELGLRKGYNLVGCNFTGVKAFFVRSDLVRDLFLEPFTAEIHYEPPRYFLIRDIGHSRDFGDFETI